MDASEIVNDESIDGGKRDRKRAAKVWTDSGLGAMTNPARPRKRRMGEVSGDGIDLHHSKM